MSIPCADFEICARFELKMRKRRRLHDRTAAGNSFASGRARRDVDSRTGGSAVRQRSVRFGAMWRCSKRRARCGVFTAVCCRQALKVWFPCWFAMASIPRRRSASQAARRKWCRRRDDSSGRIEHRSANAQIPRAQARTDDHHQQRPRFRRARRVRRRGLLHRRAIQPRKPCVRRPRSGIVRARNFGGYAVLFKPGYFPIPAKSATIPSLKRRCGASCSIARTNAYS